MTPYPIFVAILKSAISKKKIGLFYLTIFTGSTHHSYDRTMLARFCVQSLSTLNISTGRKVYLNKRQKKQQTATSSKLWNITAKSAANESGARYPDILPI